MGIQEATRAYHAGNLKLAYQLCRETIAAQPANHVALNLMGAISGAGGRHDLAAKWMGKAAEFAPADLSYRMNYLTALMRVGDADRLRVELVKAMEAFPRSAELLTMRGLMAGRDGEIDTASELLAKALEINPKSAAACFNLSVLRHSQGREAESVELLRRTLEIDPKNVQAVNNLAGMLLDAGECLEALKYLQKYLELDPRSAQAYFNLSLALDMSGDSEQSIIALKNALKLDPKLKRGQFKLANHLVASGNFEEAYDLLQKWQQQEPDEPRLIAVQSRYLERQGRVEEARAKLDEIRPEDREIAMVKMSNAALLEVEGNYAEAAELLEGLVAERSVDAVESLGIRFALGSIYDAMKEFDKAFENYRLGNEVRRKGFPVPFDGDRNQENFSVIADAYVAGWPQAKLADGTFAGCDSSVPIFILGMPRSGTSLTEQILGCHSQIFPAGELREFSAAVRKTHGEPEEADAGGGFKIVENELAGHQSPVIPGEFDRETLQQIGQSYVDAVVALSGGEPHVTDKMPFNFLFAPLIKMALPNAKIIHTRRNPVDTCLSCYFQNFAGGSEFSFDLRDAGLYYRNYEMVMDRWRNELGLEMLEVDYEETVTDTETVVRRILDFCGLEFEPECLSAHRSKRPVITASYQQVRQPVYTKSVERWRNYEQHLSPLLEVLGL